MFGQGYQNHSPGLTNGQSSVPNVTIVINILLACYDDVQKLSFAKIGKEWSTNILLINNKY